MKGRKKWALVSLAVLALTAVMPLANGIAAAASSTGPSGGVVINGVNVPREIIPGYEVITVVTPAQNPCVIRPHLTLKGPYPDPQSFLSSGDGVKIEESLKKLGLSDVEFGVTGPQADAAQAQANDDRWEKTERALGCIQSGMLSPKGVSGSSAGTSWSVTGSQLGILPQNTTVPGEPGGSTPTPSWPRNAAEKQTPDGGASTRSLGSASTDPSSPDGFALILDTDAGSYSTDNGQGVDLIAPLYGTNQTAFSMLLNSAQTDTLDVIRDGFVISAPSGKGSGEGDVMWTDSSYSLLMQPLDSMVYWPNDTYRFTLTLTSGTWWACGQDLGPSGSDYQCEPSTISGSQLVQAADTSVFVENANTNADWYVGFTDPLGNEEMHANQADIYLNGSPTAWASEAHRIQDPCSSSVPDTIGATTGSLESHQTATYNLSKVPLAQRSS